MSRPESQGPPQYFYNDEEAAKYTKNSRIRTIQKKLSERALELLNLEECSLILDVGCGSGLSGEVVAKAGHYWVGVDISESMLNVFHNKRNKPINDLEMISEEEEEEDDDDDDNDDMDTEEEDDDNEEEENNKNLLNNGDAVLNDIGDGVPFRPASFDAIISISAIQWLCNSDRNDHNPIKRLRKFFQTIFASLVQGGKAVFQFYPSSQTQADLIMKQAMLCGFTGGLVIDYPNSTRAKKIYLCLFTGGTINDLPPNLDDSKNQLNLRRERGNVKKNKKGPTITRRQRVLSKKERRRRQGKEVRADTKYTGRRRKIAF
ncbi:hypothetical protein SNEBB_002335 [Seison nebaliae]|nr:hypothetical protein SNEBB_002335 [Seison nebaliae]